MHFCHLEFAVIFMKSGFINILRTIFFFALKKNKYKKYSIYYTMAYFGLYTYYAKIIYILFGDFYRSYSKSEIAGYVNGNQAAAILTKHAKRTTYLTV